jgi:hypothetical protein
MGILLSVYAALAVLVPALWICVSLRVPETSRAAGPPPTARLIHFPSDFRRAPPPSA